MINSIFFWFLERFIFKIVILFIIIFQNGYSGEKRRFSEKYLGKNVSLSLSLSREGVNLLRTPFIVLSMIPVTKPVLNRGRGKKGRRNMKLQLQCELRKILFSIIQRKRNWILYCLEVI